MKVLKHIFKSHPLGCKILILSILISFTSCKKFVEPGSPSTKVDQASVFQSDAAAISLMNGIYVRAESLTSNFTKLSATYGLSADELNGPENASTATYTLYYKNALVSTGFLYYWAEFYQYIYTTNEILEGLAGPNNISDPVKARLTGEAKFIRAYFYLNLVNLFGNVPLITTTNYQDNVLLSRTPVNQVYVQIIQDLKDAQSILGANYTTGDLKTTSPDRVRPNQTAATALLARVYLFTGDYANAITESTKVINQSSVYFLETLSRVFLSTSKETILAFQPVTLNQNTYQGSTFILITTPTPSSVSVSNNLLNAFEDGDSRKLSWIGSYTTTTTTPKTYLYPYKYKVYPTGAASVPLTEDDVILRLGEQYLIRAEAYIQTSQIPLGIADLNAVRTRARAVATVAIPNPLPALSTTLSLTNAMIALEHERQVEMFTEYGDRWLTLKRLKGFNNPAISRADEVMPAITAQKGGTWSTNWQLYPIPATEIVKDKNLVQNPGYN